MKHGSGNHGFRGLALVCAAAGMLGLLLSGCPQPGDDNGPVFVAVSSITDVPAAGTAGADLALSGTVSPANASNKTIVWSVKDAGTAGATISGNTLSSTDHGTVVVTAAIADGTAVGTAYTQDFSISISADFVAVSGIAGIPTVWTAGVNLALSGTVSPANASNKTIVWSVKDEGTTGAAVNGNTLSSTAQGTVVVTATIANGTAAGTAYTQDFTINILSTSANVTAQGINYAFKLVLGGTVSEANTGTMVSNWGMGGSHVYRRPCTVNTFYIGETEITYELWEAVSTWAVANKGYRFANTGAQGGRSTVGTPQHPVTKISWQDAVVWCNAYSEATGRTPAYTHNGEVLRESKDSEAWKTEYADIDTITGGFRLPTEAEWEYAARGGVPSTGTPWSYTYAGSNNADDVAVYDFSDSGNNNTAEVKSKNANSLGLYDMSGNVGEWCQNYFWVGYSEMTRARAYRGGSWRDSSVSISYLTVAHRDQDAPDRDPPLDVIGFRVVYGP
jgi:formylglycine-generating enzyme required for sulfatase activity